ncbi:MAG: phosphatase PAP2 family protein [Phycisphaerales bacterium]
MTDATRANFLKRISAYAAAGMVLALALWLAHSLDAAAYQLVHTENVLRRDWARMFRVCGYLPVWLLAAAALWMLDAGPKRPPGREALSWSSIRRAAWLAVNPALTGLVCEVLKITVRRERPADESPAGGAAADAAAGGTGPAMYTFRPWAGAEGQDWWSSGGLGFPSSHVGVAAGAAAALICLFPRAWPVWVALPIGCALTRLLDRAHYLSDCVGAMVAAIVVAAVLMPVFRGVNHRHAADR